MSAGISRDHRRRRATALLALAASLAVFGSAHAQHPLHRSLTGRLLVATDAMTDTRFERTVIYLVHHDASGALGLVINLPITDVSYERALTPFGLEVPPGSGTVRVYYGGPVEDRRAFVLHTPDWKVETTTVIDGDFAVTEDPRVLQAIARGTGPKHALFVLGYAGWAPGQLDAELGTGAWAVARADPRLVFEESPGQKWIEAMTRRILEL